ncbi:hypothetical protein [Pontibacter russatus]|uniref:hypothetical protein n=1 Tax=Pontibacter russatus TaxID=2694929 RepID=UPI00137A1E96|nr:hypothetical protein [Pontibacter russatus]
MNNIAFNYRLIEETFDIAEKAILDKSNIVQIIYNDFDCTTFDSNNKATLDSLAGNAIIYCIWSGKTPADFSPKYIGHAGKLISRQRIRNHLSKKHLATGAQLDRIKLELENKNSIGLSYLIIEPDYMRKPLEDWLISKHSGLLEWNQVGKRKTTHNNV